MLQNKKNAKTFKETPRSISVAINFSEKLKTNYKERKSAQFPSLNKEKTNEIETKLQLYTFKKHEEE